MNSAGVFSRLSRGVAVWFAVASLYSPAFWVISKYGLSTDEISPAHGVALLLMLLPLLVFLEFSSMSREQHQEHLEEERQAFRQGYSEGRAAGRQERIR